MLCWDRILGGDIRKLFIPAKKAKARPLRRKTGAGNGTAAALPEEQDDEASLHGGDCTIERGTVACVGGAPHHTAVVSQPECFAHSQGVQIHDFG